MKPILIAALSALTWSCTPSSAADLKMAPAYKAPPVTSTYNWSGIYLEGFGDYGGNFGNANASMGSLVSIDLAQIPHGPGIGGALEALYQSTGSSWVIGLRAEIGYTNFQATGNLAALGINELSLGSATNYVGAFNAELGYTIEPQLLAYVTGGLGFAGAKPNLSAAGLCLGGTSCSQAAADTSVGFDVGAGLRYAIPQTPISLFIEGDYYGLGSKSLSIGSPPIVTSNTQFNIFMQKVGLTWKIGG